MGKPLENLDFTIIDCQTTGATPKKGHIIELGWMTVRGAPPVADVINRRRSELVALPPGADLPPQVSKITGICKEDLDEAPSVEQVWQRLLDEVQERSTASELRFVAHYARFEKKFIEDLIARVGIADFEWRFLCTHDLARRLLPNLPRLSMRALSGHLGYRLPEKKRAADHVLATGHVWHELANMLKVEKGVDDLDALQVFQKLPLPKKDSQKTYLLAKDKLQSLPTVPGVYRFFDCNKKLLYIGKAANLRARVGSYFRSSAKQSEHILEMITQAQDVSFETTETRLEAALAEADLIKKRDPPYNRALRDTEGKGLAFFDEGFEGFDSFFDQPFSAGPFPRCTSVEKFCTIARVLCSAGGSAGEIEARDSGKKDCESNTIFGNHLIEEDVFRRGMQAVKAAYIGAAEEVSSRRLLALCVILGEYRRLKNKEKRENEPETEAAAQNLPEPQRDPGVEDDTSDWTSRRVTKTVLGLLGNMGTYWRRSLLFRFLADSVINWQFSEKKTGPKRQPTEQWRWIEITSTHVEQRGYKTDNDPDFVPLEMRPNWNKRGKNFDKTNYDRLRVLETELKRIIAEGRCVRVSFDRRLCLSEQRLNGILGGD